VKIIFLDIDGPMIPSGMFLIHRNASFERQFSPLCIAVANEMCRVTGAKIVLNTTHNRELHGVPNIDQALIQQGLVATHLHPIDRHTRYPDLARNLAIKEWLAQHDEVEEWVAVDDCQCAEAPNMVLVDPDCGIHTGTLYQVCAVLGGTPPLFLL